MVDLNSHCRAMHDVRAGFVFLDLSCGRWLRLPGWEITVGGGYVTPWSHSKYTTHLKHTSNSLATKTFVIGIENFNSVYL